MYHIILASGSPRRKEIMDTMEIPYQVITADVEERTEETVPAKMVQALASLKANAVLPQVRKLAKEYEQSGEQAEFIIIGADTMVFYEGQAMGKPKNEQDAARMLRHLSDDTHEVYTGVSILVLRKAGTVEEWKLSTCTKVVVRPLSEEQIKDYILTGEPMDKAGAYAIQGKFGIYIREIIGDYYNIVGFPIAKIYDTLLEHGIDMKKLG